MRAFIRLGDHPARKIARSDISDFSLLDEQVHGLPDLVQRRDAIEMMHLKQVDMIGLQAREAIIAGLNDMPG